MTTGRRVVSARSLVEESDLPAHEATRLIQKATGRSLTELAIEDAVGALAAGDYAELVRRRRSGEPLQYIEGTSQFGPVEVAVDPRVLIPRPETEQLWELVTTRLETQPPRVIVDLGTGSANLAIALQHSFPGADVHAVDLSGPALEVAADNVANSGFQITLHQGDLYEALPPQLEGRADLVISNPPYIARRDRSSLPVEVRDHEPDIALFGGPDGLAVLRRVIAGAHHWLRAGGMLACEIGSEQGDAVRELAAGLRPEIVRDLSGRDRFLIAQKGME